MYFLKTSLTNHVASMIQLKEILKILPRTTAADEVVRDIAFNIAKKSKI